MTKLKDTERLYVASMGKILRITAMFPDTDEGTDEANSFMGKPGNRDAVVACMAGLTLLADKYDTGFKPEPRAKSMASIFEGGETQ